MRRQASHFGIIGSVRPWRGALLAGLGCWAVGFAWHWWRPGSLWLLDLFVIPFTALLYLGGLVLVIVAVVRSRRLLALVTLVPALIVATVVVNPTWRHAPRTWFALHRPLYQRALETDPGSDYYGAKLPVPLRFLTEGGQVSEHDGSRFFPQWIGIPDDAGGYLYSPHGSPEGVDLYGMSCTGPVDLGGGWWMCGMADTGF
jgi:hypothetical protein